MFNSHNRPTSAPTSTAMASQAMKPSLWRYVAAGLLLLLLPLFLTSYHAQQIKNGTTLRLPVTLKPQIGPNYKMTEIFSKYRLSTPLNRLSTADMAGQNHFRAQDPIFVFLSPGPSDIWYPYAVFKAPSGQACPLSDCLIVKGRVLSRVGDDMNIRYQFENYVPPHKTQMALDGATQTKASSVSANTQSLLLSINAKGQARLMSMIIEGQEYPQPLGGLLDPLAALLGLSNNTANAAPVQ